MTSDRVDRTLSEDPVDVVWTDGSNVYHVQTRDEPVLTNCALSLDPDNVTNADESDALESGLRRCERCNFDSPLAIHIAGSKSFHDVSRRREGGLRTKCSAASNFDNRTDTALRSVECLEHNGIERCETCYDDA